MIKIIFFGNGPLADFALQGLKTHQNLEIIFHARTKEDLATVKEIKRKNPEAYGVLASYGVMIKSDVLDLFEPTGILNIHPSLLPKYRGASPIETAIKNGDQSFSVSVMKLVRAMDAGPLFYQVTFSEAEIFAQAPESYQNAALYKTAIYQKLAQTGAAWISENLAHLPEPKEQVGEPTFTEKFDKSMSKLSPETQTASEMLAMIRAFSGFPKSKYEFFGLDCTIISAHVATPEEATNCTANVHTLYIQCADDSILIIDQIQPAGRKIMDAKSFLNGYKK